MLEPLKPLYNATLKPAALGCIRIGIHPNHVTVVGLLLFMTGGFFCAKGQWITALVLVVTGSLMDGLDGVLARESGKKNRFGAILDSGCDRLTEMALFGGLLYFYQHTTAFPGYTPLLCFAALCSSVMVSYVKARCEAEGIACSRGLLQRPERLTLLSIGLLAGPNVMFWVVAAITILGTYTTIERFILAAKK